ncbi:hypothetical protein F5887DRAFT_1075618 [Amanita rubescens]|nr:hypothetical protein F5887DRAFT_1075618 [Amanita rubescens]
MDSDSMDIPTSRRIRIPLEIVYDIFSHLSSPLRVDRAHEFPWYLGQVCSEWRSIFLSMLPYFWKEIQIEWRKHLNEEDDYEHVATMLAFFLDTIRGAAFSFTLRRYGRKILSSTQLILEKLLDHSEQWEKASMQLQELEFATLHRLKNHLPLLQELRLDILRNPELEYEDTSFVPPGDVFASAPLLTHINLENFSDILWGFNWSSLTGITLTYADSINIVISALRQTINLEELTIHEGFAGDEMVDIGIIGIIKLPRLRYLFLEGVSLFIRKTVENG